MDRSLDVSQKPVEPIGRADAFVTLLERASRVASVDRPVLVVGERGTGKELVAHRVHYLSKRWSEPLVTVHCASLSPTLMESELFGHEAGAFTGATGKRQGRFEFADGGTLFLDEIGSVPLKVQEKILRVVEYGTFERVGSSRSMRADVRVVGATNADLRALAREGRFMWDLLDRLSFEVLGVPPLRDRREDILLLARHFASRFAMELGREGIPVFTERVEQVLLDHSWPGNVRELKNVVERAVYSSGGEEIDDVVLDPFEGILPSQPEMEGGDSPKSFGSDEGLGESLPEAVDRLRHTMIRRALEQAKYNQREAARRLGLTYHQFRGLYRKYRAELVG